MLSTWSLHFNIKEETKDTQVKVNEQGNALCHPEGTLVTLILLLRSTDAQGEFLCLNECIKASELLEVHCASI